jgi:hypothetical protein
MLAENSVGPESATARSRQPRCSASSRSAATRRRPRSWNRRWQAQWDSELVGLYGECLGADVIRQIERAEKWLTDNPRDAVLLLVLGKAMRAAGIVGQGARATSKRAFRSSRPILRTSRSPSCTTASATRMRRAGITGRSLELAVAQLKQMTGGRRRTPL